MLFTIEEADRELSPDIRSNTKTPYYEPLQGGAAIAGGSSNGASVTLQNVAAFQLFALVGRVWIDGAPETAIQDPPLTIQAQVASGSFITDGAGLWGSVVVSPASYNAGLGGLPAPITIGGGQTFSITVTSYALVGTLYWWRLDLVGRNILNPA